MGERHQDPSRLAGMMRQTKRDAADGVITTFSDIPLADMRSADVLDVNWTALRNRVQDMIDRVTDEGELDTETIGEIIRLVTTALGELAHQEEALERSLQTTPETTVLHNLAQWIPGNIGERAAAMIKDRHFVEKKAQRVKELTIEIRNLRKQLADAVDQGLHRKLLRESNEYRALQEERDNMRGTYETAAEILKALEQSTSKDPSEKKKAPNIGQNMPSWVKFYREHNLTPDIGTKYNLHSGNRELLFQFSAQDLLPGIRTFVETLRRKDETIDHQLTSMRNRLKGEIYNKYREKK